MLVRWERLAPNTAVAHSTVTATTEPTRAEPTGTAARPRPRSRACRTPISALAGILAPASSITTREGPAGAASGS